MPAGVIAPTLLASANDQGEGVARGDVNLPLAGDQTKQLTRAGARSCFGAEQKSRNAKSSRKSTSRPNETRSMAATC
jgi:hypothetical protein